MKKRYFFYILLSLLGLCIACYPVASELYHEKQTTQIMQEYEKKLSADTEETMEKMLKAAQDYNSGLIGSHIKNIYIASEREETSFYYSLLNYTGDGCMGSVEIPCIDMTLPIYHFTDETSLSRGAGHLQGSSLPVGGIGTHSVLLAHRGLPGKRLFTDLDKVTVGNMFYLHVLGHTLAYEVVSVETVSPDNADSLSIDENQDKCTLVTCTPYAVNHMRLLVHGIRTEEKETVLPEHSMLSGNVRFAFPQMGYAAAGIAAAILFSAAVDQSKKKFLKKEHDDETAC